MERLLASNFDPDLDYFELSMKRRHARDLRKGLFGPKGSREMPDFAAVDYGEMWFDLPRGWSLHLIYEPRPRSFEAAGNVTAEFIPPELPFLKREAAHSAQEVLH